MIGGEHVAVVSNSCVLLLVGGEHVAVVRVSCVILMIGGAPIADSPENVNQDGTEQP